MPVGPCAVRDHLVVDVDVVARDILPRADAGGLAGHEDTVLHAVEREVGVALDGEQQRLDQRWTGTGPGGSSGMPGRGESAGGARRAAGSPGTWCWTTTHGHAAVSRGGASARWSRDATRPAPSRPGWPPRSTSVRRHHPARRAAGLRPRSAASPARGRRPVSPRAPWPPAPCRRPRRRGSGSWSAPPRSRHRARGAWLPRWRRRRR